MTVSLPIPAAHYLRMSTGHQQYSTENQAHSTSNLPNSTVSQSPALIVIPRKSAYGSSGDPVLRELLGDVTDGKTDHKGILVYDVRRRGRFQDTDEAAHYEFGAKSAGIPVHDCAETFANDGSLPSSIMEALKRVMAGEYSRELGVELLLVRDARLSLGSGEVAASYGFW